MEKTIQKYLSAVSEGKITEKDFNDLLRIAELGESRAQCGVAKTYFNGTHFLEQNYQKSFEWFLKSAEQNHFWSQYLVGLMYLEGKGIEQNEDKALQWLRKSSADEARILIKKMEYRQTNVAQKFKKTVCRFLDGVKNMMCFKHNSSTANLITKIKDFEFSEIPDTPISFCYKTAWIAIKGTDTENVIKILRLQNAKKANWVTGFAAAYESRNGWTFVAPPIKGWLFIVNSQFDIFSTHPEQTECYKFISGIAKKFPELYFFSSHRVSEYHCWMYIKNGSLERIFCYGDGEILCEKGEMTKEEIMCGLNFEKLRNNEWDDDMELPNEESVHAISSAWTIDTLALKNMNLEKSVGIVGIIDYMHGN
jgi:hypothetical protein